METNITTWEEIHKKRKGVFPKVNLLKASHHDGPSGYHYESVKAMNPDLTVLSVGELKKKDDASASYERFNKGSDHARLREHHCKVLGERFGLFVRSEDNGDSTLFLSASGCLPKAVCA